MKKGDYTKLARKWLENSSKFELDGLALEGMNIYIVEQGFIKCSLVIPNHLSDVDGNWKAGAMSVLIDDITAGAVFSITGGHLATVDFTMSFYSTAKVNEEVEIEASVVGETGNLFSVVTDIRKKGTGEKVVVGKQWMQATPIKTSQAAKSKL
uniref:uncharacterized protein LOC122608412 n=1 Tax=Erigeron canadensis TaxID=72917 RepID=UPI001CB937F3|nr:uncharacterized protein LOC122608412 [Erigeron canadensis]